jgi:hypothetical protein
MDRNEIELAWELSVTDKSIKPNRKYLNVSELKHVEGWICVPPIMLLFNETSAEKNLL